MKRWYVIFAKPRKERQVRDRLAEQGIEVFLPFLLCLRPDAPARPRPLFPRYLFVHFDLAETSVERIRWTPGLASLVMFDGQYAAVENDVIAYIRKRLDGLEARRHTPFAPGQQVRLPGDHPFARMEAIFEKPCSDAKRAYILLETLGRIIRCQIEIVRLDPVDGLLF
jgi:transcription elongation factor/antiterminator RfaH